MSSVDTNIKKEEQDRKVRVGTDAVVQGQATSPAPGGANQVVIDRSGQTQGQTPTSQVPSGTNGKVGTNGQVVNQGEKKQEETKKPKTRSTSRSAIKGQALSFSGLYNEGAEESLRERQDRVKPIDAKDVPTEQDAIESADEEAPVSDEGVGDSSEVSEADKIDNFNELGYVPGSNLYLDKRTGVVKQSKYPFPILSKSFESRANSGWAKRRTHKPGELSEYEKKRQESKKRADERDAKHGFVPPAAPEPEQFDYPEVDEKTWLEYRRNWLDKDSVIKDAVDQEHTWDEDDTNVVNDMKRYWNEYDRERALKDRPAGLGEWVKVDPEVAEKGNDAIGDFLRNLLDKNVQKAYDEKSEKEPHESDDPNRHRIDQRFLRKMREARNAMIHRLMNPWVLRFESEVVETRTENGVTYARLTWKDPRVEECLNRISRKYDCTWFNVMQLLQLRAGLGIGFDGLIAGVDPSKYKMSVDHLVEFTDDILLSQEKHGHPLGLVDGPPLWNGLRDDSGQFVVMNGTRCYPLGCMPVQLITDLSKHYESPFYGKTVEQIQELVADSWINDTHPAIIANAKGDAMKQAYAIENQMRAVLTMNGTDPETLGIPKLVMNKTLLMMQSEKAAAGDEQIEIGLNEKNKRYRNSASRNERRWRKESGGRNEDGSFKEPGERRRSSLEDSLGGLVKLSQAAKVANLLLWVSNPIEGVVSQAQETFGNFVADNIFAALNPEVASRHQYTARLRQAAEDSTTIEALAVWDALYRIGGQTAIDAYNAELDEAGHTRNKYTNTDLRRWLQEVGVIGSNTLTERAMSLFGVKPGQASGFLANAQSIASGLEDLYLGSSNLFKGAQAKQFIKRACAEMGQFDAIKKEAYTSSEMEQWYAYGGGEQLIRDLTNTNAGREAFQTIGVTSLGRRSPVEHLMRRVMSANGVTEFAIRTMFDRFPEYGVQKILRQIPFSNTLSYIGAMGISSLGDMNEAGLRGALGRVSGYQIGSRYGDFWLGFRKNLMYDLLMCGSNLAGAFIIHGLITALGGLHEPPEDENRWTYSEWYIGDGEDAIPIKWAWWTDDLMGIILPLGMAITIAQQGDWSPEARQDASAVFMNAVVNFDDGTAVFDAIDLVRNFDEHMENLFGGNVDGYDPTFDERARASIIIGLMDFFGDMTPAFLGQIIPWSRDYIFAGDTYEHTASKVYETDGYTREEAEELGKTTDVDDYVEDRIRHETANNWLAGLAMDLFTGAWRDGSDVTSFRYGYMPLSTRADPYDLSSNSPYMKFWLDTSLDGNLPDDPNRRASSLDAHAEEVLNEIRHQGWDTPYEAARNGFALNLEAFQNCRQYCLGRWKQLNAELSARKDEEGGYLPDEEYDSYQQRINYYYALWHDWFAYDSDIPIAMPRYIEQNSDYETRYVDAEGNAATWLDYIRGDAERERYAYGNAQTFLPFATQRTKGKAFNNETPTYHALMDSEGNVHGNLQALRESAAGSEVLMGRDTGSEALELMAGGQGTNLMDDVHEELRIPEDEAMTLGGSQGRVWVIDVSKLPDWVLDDDEICKSLGIDPSIRNAGEDDESSSEDKDKGSLSAATTPKESPDDNGYGGYYSGGYYSRGGGYYSSGGGGGSSYTPRIYSTSGDVYSSRPSGMGVRTPYKPTSTYLRPSYSTKGSREAYRRNDL